MIFIFKWAIFKVSRQLSGVYTLEIKHWYQKIMVWKMYLLWQMKKCVGIYDVQLLPPSSEPVGWSWWSSLNGPSCFVLRGATSCCEAMLFLWFASSPGIRGNGPTGNRPWRSREFPRPFPKVFFSEGKWAIFFAHLRFFTKHQRKLVNMHQCWILRSDYIASGYLPLRSQVLYKITLFHSDF